jgi:hypothetical protein
MEESTINYLVYHNFDISTILQSGYADKINYITCSTQTCLYDSSEPAGHQNGKEL